MGILDVFKKKKDDFNTNPDQGMPLQGNEYGQPQQQQYPPFGEQQGFQQDPFASQPQQQQYPPFGEQQGQQQPPQHDPYAGWEKVPPGQQGFSRGPSPQSATEVTTLKEFELINAKLDAIKSELDSVNQRLKRMERLTEGSGTPGKHEAWY